MVWGVAYDRSTCPPGSLQHMLRWHSPRMESPVLRALTLLDCRHREALSRWWTRPARSVAKALNETTVLVTIGRGVVAPASIRPIYGPDGREASGLATWQAGGSVLFTSPDCTTGAHVYGSSRAGVRATTQVQTRAGISLYVGAVGQATTVSVQSILYDTGCAPVVVRQNGLHPVEATVNLDVAYPPPLSFQ